jgi:hypothetical protein
MYPAILLWTYTLSQLQSVKITLSFARADGAAANTQTKRKLAKSFLMMHSFRYSGRLPTFLKATAAKPQTFRGHYAPVFD